MATDLDSTLAASARAYLAHREAQIQTLQKGRIQARLDLFVETTGIYGFIEYVLTQERMGKTPQTREESCTNEA